MLQIYQQVDVVVDAQVAAPHLAQNGNVLLQNLVLNQNLAHQSASVNVAALTVTVVVVANVAALNLILRLGWLNHRAVGFFQRIG